MATRVQNRGRPAIKPIVETPKAALEAGVLRGLWLCDASKSPPFYYSTYYVFSPILHKVGIPLHVPAVYILVAKRLDSPVPRVTPSFVRPSSFV